MPVSETSPQAAQHEGPARRRVAVSGGGIFVLMLLYVFLLKNNEQEAFFVKSTVTFKNVHL